MRYLLNWLMLFAAVAVLAAGGEVAERWLTVHHASAFQHMPQNGETGGNS